MALDRIATTKPGAQREEDAEEKRRRLAEFDERVRAFHGANRDGEGQG